MVDRADPDAPDGDVLRRLEVLREGYRSRLPGRVSEIEDAFLGLCDRWDPVRAEGLCRQAHNLKGSGSTYGMPGLSEAAGRLEGLLREILGRARPPTDEDRRGVEGRLRGLRESIA